MTTTWRSILFVLCVACAAREEESRAPSRRPAPTASAPSGQLQRGHAAYYAQRFHGRKTASGERFDVNKLTAAHRKLPFGTRVKVTNLKNGRSVVVRINDRGPYARGGLIDLSPAAARQLDMIKDGTVPVTVEVLSRPPCGAGKRC
jgi:rare lipoprotein A